MRPTFRRAVQASVAVTVLAIASLSFASPAQARPILCSSGEVNDTVTSITWRYSASQDDLIVYTAPSSGSITISENFSKTASLNASLSGTVGTHATVGAALKIFNASAGYTFSFTGSIAGSLSYTTSMTANFTVPAGHSWVRFIGFRSKSGIVTHQTCAPNGLSFVTEWSTKVSGPVLKTYAVLDCKDTGVLFC
jgi:hypothetical protein